MHPEDDVTISDISDVSDATYASIIPAVPTRESAPPVPPPVPVGAGAMRDLKGEDRWKLRTESIGGESILFAVVADGHGGQAAAQRCADTVVPYILDAAAGDASGAALRRAGRAAFQRLHAEVRSTQANDGTTCTVCMTNPLRGELTTVHVGDSAAILVPHVVKGTPARKPTRLTAEHRLQESTREQARVVTMGGKVGRLQHPVTKEPAGPLRAFPGGVACARSIGDADVGSLISAVPASSTVPLRWLAHTGWDVVVASDGVWDALSPAAIVRLCRHAPRAPAQNLAELITEQAVSARHAFNNSGFMVPRDDTTCVVLRCAAVVDAHNCDGVHPKSGGGGCTLPSRCELPSLVAEPIELDDSYIEDEDAAAEAQGQARGS